MKNDIGQKIKSLRKSRGLTQTELAEKLGLRCSTVSGYETGYRTPKVRELESIAKFFGVGLDYFGIASQDEVMEVLARARKIFENEAVPAAEKDELYREIMRLYLSINDNKGK